ncbi:hypothetical protein ACFQ3L_11355 [Lacticaseibacillus jixianensis]|uniref:Uncharacterized protein n=1 Tax=Lacticaseibacillus jixianensis TaxID=2486012 RepID=A0ABW4BD22_9LACO|nr:hypothetical protein [Lacticaseibacillus jixianensis]
MFVFGIDINKSQLKVSDHKVDGSIAAAYAGISFGGRETILIGTASLLDDRAGKLFAISINGTMPVIIYNEAFPIIFVSGG